MMWPAGSFEKGLKGVVGWWGVDGACAGRVWTARARVERGGGVVGCGRRVRGRRADTPRASQLRVEACGVVCGGAWGRLESSRRHT
eukprot:347234-Chlamydomonas_euryale.AAC.2